MSSALAEMGWKHLKACFSVHTLLRVYEHLKDIKKVFRVKTSKNV